MDLNKPSQSHYFYTLTGTLTAIKFKRISFYLKFVELLETSNAHEKNKVWDKRIFQTIWDLRGYKREPTSFQLICMTFKNWLANSNKALLLTLVLSEPTTKILRSNFACFLNFSSYGFKRVYTDTFQRFFKLCQRNFHKNLKRLMICCRLVCIEHRIL